MEKEKEEKKIFVGMFRPPWEKISTGGGYIQCSCGQILQTQEATREHWQLGHFDSPIYKTLNPSTPSDTFIEGIIKKFREQFVASDNRFLTGTETVGNAEKFIRQSFKSSLQEQREIIEKEIKTKIRVARSEGYLSYCKENGVEPKLGKGN